MSEPTEETGPDGMMYATRMIVPSSAPSTDVNKDLTEPTEETGPDGMIYATRMVAFTSQPLETLEPPRPAPPSSQPTEKQQPILSRLSARGIVNSVGETISSIKSSVLKSVDNVVLEDEELNDPVARAESVRNWSKEQQSQLEAGLKAHTGETMTPEVWDDIARGVQGKSGVECMDRYNYVVQALAARTSNRPPPPAVSVAAPLPPPPSNPAPPPPPQQSHSLLGSLFSSLFSSSSSSSASHPPTSSSGSAASRQVTAPSPSAPFVEPIQQKSAQLAAEGLTPVAFGADNGPILISLSAPLTDVAAAFKKRVSPQQPVILWDATQRRFVCEVGVASLLAFRLSHPSLDGHLASALTDPSLRCVSLPVAVVPKSALQSVTSVREILRVYMQNPSIVRIYILGDDQQQQQDAAATPLVLSSSVNRTSVLKWLLDTNAAPLSEPLSLLPPVAAAPDAAAHNDELLISAIRLMCLKNTSIVPIISEPGHAFVGELSSAQLDQAGWEDGAASLRRTVSSFIASRTQSQLQVTPQATFGMVLKSLLDVPTADHVCVVDKDKFIRTVSIKDVLIHLQKQQ